MTTRSANVTVHLDGDAFTSWTNVTVQRSVESLAGGFSLDLSSFQSGLAVPGRVVEIRIDGLLMMQGIVDRVSGGKSGRSHTRRMEGRDSTADLIDCAGVVKSYELRNVSLEDIFEQLAAPFGFHAEFDAGGTGDRFEKFAVEPGESAWSSLERACRLRAMLAYTAPTGVIQIRRASADKIDYPLVDGENIEDWSVTVDHSSRFASYVVRGSSPGNDDTWGATVAQVQGSAIDEGIKRYRPMEIVAEGNVSKATAEIRAQWEASVRAARASQVEIVVPGWRIGQWLDDSLRDPWSINTRVPVRIDEFGLDDTLLIADLVFEHGGGGTKTKLNVVRPDSYQPEPVLDERDDDADLDIDEMESQEYGDR